MTRHINGFRPLREGEQWHREDWPDELPPGYRPLIIGEPFLTHECYRDGGVWTQTVSDDPNNLVGSSYAPFWWLRTNRPLPD